jgi:hypothetical protein
MGLSRLLLRYPVNEKSTIHAIEGSETEARRRREVIRQRRNGWQVVVYAGLDPLTGKQRQVSR